MTLLRKLNSIILSILLIACVDRIQFDIDKVASRGISVSGSITNQPGPYIIYLNSVFDIESQESIKTPVTARRVTVIDDYGIEEFLIPAQSGVYQTQSLQGVVGRAYKVRIEFDDGRIYESELDTLYAPGSMESITFTFNETEELSERNVDYGFDIFFNSTKGDSKRRQFMWRMVGTFKSDTRPDLAPFDSFGCNPNDKGLCNFYPFCSGIRITTPPWIQPPIFERVAPCSCCTCWYRLFNEAPILSDDVFSTANEFRNIKMGRVPVNGWIFMYKIHIEIDQLTLSESTFRFYKAIREQKEAIGDLFQPITGKIPTNLVQLAGPEYPIYGYFYSAGVDKKSIYINRTDVPGKVQIPSTMGVDGVDCLDLFPNSTTERPDFWVD